MRILAVGVSGAAASGDEDVAVTPKLSGAAGPRPRLEDVAAAGPRPRLEDVAVTAKLSGAAGARPRLVARVCGDEDAAATAELSGAAGPRARLVARMWVAMSMLL